MLLRTLFFEAHRKTDLALPCKDFDQTLGGGYRQLVEPGCYKEAGDLLEEWMRVNRSEVESVRWHVVQQRALQGDAATAVRWAKGTLHEHEDYAQDPLRWNDYVLATIAFLEQDRAALLAHRERIAAGADSHGNAVNLKLVDAMVARFGQGYASAYALASKG